MSGDWLKLLLIPFLVLANGFFVAAEFALVSVRPTRIDDLIGQGNRLARLVKQAKDDPNRFISAAQIGITMASLGLGWVAEPTLAPVLEPLFSFLPESGQIITSHLAAGVIAYFLITLLHIVIGEQVPKMLALQRSEATALATVLGVQWTARIFRPMVALLDWLASLCLRALGLRWDGEHSLVYSENELKMLVLASQESGVIEESEQELISRVFGFADVTAEEVMVPRTEMTAMPIDSTLDEVMQIVATSGHSRFPVYGEDPDDIQGVFYAKDLYRLLALGQQDRFELRRALRAPMTVPSTMAIDDLLARMKREHTQFAVVVDEYGGTAGMVTLEDVVERIVGDLDDEYEGPPDEVKWLPNGEALVSGLISIDDAKALLGIKIDDSFYLTIGGYVFGQLGRRPESEDEVIVDGHILRVEAMDGLRIDQLRIVPLAAPDAAAETAARASD